MADLAPDPSLIGMGARQSEFERTIKAYIDDAVSASRVLRGSEAAKRWSAQLRAVQRRYGVPQEIVVAVWGMETDFGRGMGDRDVIRSLATLAFARPDGESFRDECVAALVMLEKGDVTRARLRGSWAGAMGHPQFLPSAYLRYAVSYGGGGAPDIWTSVPDSLASIAHFLREQGWKPGHPWGFEVIVPASFDWRSLTGPFAGFAAKGFRKADGRPLPVSGDATLYLPAGARGPAFLLGENYWIIKQYNNSDSYAMSVALLGERLAGRPGVHASWPPDLALLGRADRVRLQRLLHDKGYYDDKFDGRFGPASRDAIHRFQVDAGMMPADGFASAEVLARLSGAARR
jgi:lytic murein transglycosylase